MLIFAADVAVDIVVTAAAAAVVVVNVVVVLCKKVYSTLMTMYLPGVILCSSEPYIVTIYPCIKYTYSRCHVTYL